MERIYDLNTSSSHWFVRLACFWYSWFNILHRQHSVTTRPCSETSSILSKNLKWKLIFKSDNFISKSEWKSKSLYRTQIELIFTRGRIPFQLFKKKIQKLFIQWAKRNVAKQKKLKYIILSCKYLINDITLVVWICLSCFNSSSLSNHSVPYTRINLSRVRRKSTKPIIKSCKSDLNNSMSNLFLQKPILNGWFRKQ